MLGLPFWRCLFQLAHLQMCAATSTFAVAAYRNWQEIWEGIDWLGNATWLLYVPVSALGADSKLELELTAPSGTGAVLVAQVCCTGCRGRVQVSAVDWWQCCRMRGKPVVRRPHPSEQDPQAAVRVSYF